MTCCDHCAKDCQRLHEQCLNEGYPNVPDHIATGAEWEDGHCPACAERERIVAWLRKAAAKPITHIFVGDVALDDIKRGAHLDEK